MTKEITAFSTIDELTVADFLTVTLGDIVIALSAFVTVGGSYRLYSQRQRDRNDRLRNALYAEMVKSGDRIYKTAREMKTKELTEETYLPEESPVVTTVSDSNAADLGGLTDDEVTAVVNFYTKAKPVHRRLQRAIGDTEVSAVELLYIRASLVDLNNLRNEALSQIEREIEQPTKPKHREELTGGGEPTLEEIKDRI